jgi:hypothetical protein
VVLITPRQSMSGRLKWSSGLAHRVMSRLGVMVVGVLGSVE